MYNDYNLAVENEFIIIKFSVITIENGIVAGSVVQMLLQVRKLTKDIVQDGVLVYLIVELSKTYKFLILGRNACISLQVYDFYYSLKIGKEETVVVGWELLNLVQQETI